MGHTTAQGGGVWWRRVVWLWAVVGWFYLSCMVDCTAGLYTFDVFRMIQYDQAGVGPFGSQRTSVSLQAVPLAAVTEDASSLGRSKIVVAPYDQIDLTLIDEANAKAGGLLILLPPRDVKLERGVVDQWADLERQLNTREMRIPVYFAVRGPEMDEFLRTLAPGQAEAGTAVSSGGFLSGLYRDEYVMATSAADPYPIKTVTINNFQGWIGAGASGASGEGADSQAATIALVAHYDTLGVAPTLASGADANGSGVAALLELARLFSKLYGGVRTQGKYNLLLVLTGGGRLNYAGARVWAEQADQRLLASIELTVCLDALAGGDKLYLHTSRPAKDPVIGNLLRSLTVAGSVEGVEVELVHKKINISDNNIAWEHEVFSRKRIPAATISHFASPSAALFSRSNILDTPAQIDIDVLARNVKVVGEGLARYIFDLSNFSNTEVLEGSHAVSADFLRSWTTTLSSFPRVHPYIAATSPLFTALEKALGDFAEVTKQTQPWDGEIVPAAPDADVSRPSNKAPSLVFYEPSVSTLAVHKVKPGTFDLLLTLIIAVYLGLIYVYFKGVSETVKQVQALMAGKDSKKRR